MVWYQQLSGEKQSGVNKQYSCGDIPEDINNSKIGSIMPVWISQFDNAW